MTAQSDGAHELALTIINDGKNYPFRKRQGEALLNAVLAREVRNLTWTWLNIALEGSRQYEKDFGYVDSSCFTVADILGAASELADYYRNHARETAALQDINDGESDP